MPLKLTDEKTCHCSNWKGQENLSPGETIEIWAAYPAPPEDVELMTVMTPVTPDFLDIPITEAASPDPDIVNTPVAEPRILDFWAFQDDIDGSSSRSETGDTTSITLSSDVLFELNESTLTDAADETLRAVAEEIDASSTTTVKSMVTPITRATMPLTTLFLWIAPRQWRRDSKSSSPGMNHL